MPQGRASLPLFGCGRRPRYELASPAFYRRFEAGELGDAADFFEWAGLYELREDLARKIERMETAA